MILTLPKKKRDLIMTLLIFNYILPNTLLLMTHGSLAANGPVFEKQNKDW